MESWNMYFSLREIRLYSWVYIQSHHNKVTITAMKYRTTGKPKRYLEKSRDL